MFDYHYSQQQYEGSECTFTNMFMWRKMFNITWCEEAEFLCIRADRHNSPFFLPPFGPKSGDIGAVIDRLIAYCRENGQIFRLKGVYKHIMEQLNTVRPGLFNFTTDRDNWDYIYLTQDLIELKGRKYHGKKNHINAFRSSYPDYKYFPLTSEWLDACAQFAITWCELRTDQQPDADLEREKCAILEALRNFSVLGYKGGVITIGGQVEAFSFGERLNHEMAVIHVEKANPDIKGLYSVINQAFCQDWTDITYVNREEDMGIEGLRKAKESYKPVRLTEKYDAVLAE